MICLGEKFYTQDVLEVAPQLIGKILVRRIPDGTILRARITETEAYRGEEDTACHARAGKTKRTATLYEKGGVAYVYLCYGIHSLLNVVTGPAETPQAVLIRGLEGLNGPGRLTKAMEITTALNGTSLSDGSELWIEDDGERPCYTTSARIGIDYAAEPYRTIEWRFIRL